MAKDDVQKNPHSHLLWGVCGVVVGVLGYMLCAWLWGGGSTQTVAALRQSDLTPNMSYHFIDPILGLKNVVALPAHRYDGLQKNVSSFIHAKVASGDLDTASVLFRDVSSSDGFVINGDEEYNPASLLKVPTMIAYYQLAEDDPSVLNTRLYYSGEQNLDLQEHFASPVQLVPGTSYTVEELIEHMIKYSDNNAVTMLIQNLNATGNEDTFDNLFTNLGITQLDLTDDYITVSGFSIFFRVLYNATYLDRTYSEKALSLLAQTDFTHGIASSTLTVAPVSHKYGEFTQLNPTGQVVKRELHDCGYVYYPGHTYLLCVMTKGKDFNALDQVLSGIAKQVRDYVAHAYPAVEQS